MAVGIGYSWRKGTLDYQGRSMPVEGRGPVGAARWA